MTHLYGLIGYPLGHSFSQEYHNGYFAATGMDARYDNYEITSIDQLPALIAATPQLEGLNVTYPYKEAVMPYLDEIDAAARRIGAVNVIRIARQGPHIHLTGYNSDYTGFGRAIAPLAPHHRQALVLGTGGASKAISAALADRGIAVVKVSRHPAEGQLSYDRLDAAIMASHTLIVNATPLGMLPHADTCPPIPYEAITPRHLCYDAVYNPPETLFMRQARRQGATVANGLQMLYGQADAAREIWGI